jgi:TetR/AcrR family transcriptional regulator, fatty acid metabolism regulator protein
MSATAKKDKESTIFWAACRVIRDKGFHQARMADIAKEAGISYGLVYHYFKNKSDLFDALIKEWWRGLDELADQLIEEDKTVEQKLGSIVLYFLDQYARRPELVHLFITELSRSSTNLTPERLKPFKGLMSRTEQIITEGQKRGNLRADLKPRYLTYFFLGSVEALLSTMVLEDQPLKGEEHKQRLAGAVLTMFLDGARYRN